MVQADKLQFAIFRQLPFKSFMVRRLKTLEARTTPHMLDAEQAAKRMAAAFHDLTLARGETETSTNPLEKLKAAQRRVTVLARIFLPLHDNAEFKAAYAREVTALRRQDALGSKNTKSVSPDPRLSSFPR